MKARIGVSLVAAAVMAAAMAQLGGYGPAAAVTSPGPTEADAEEKLPLTCVQAWVESGKSYSKMLAVVKTLAKVSLANRDLTFPNSRDAGFDAGTGIAEDCKADPDALLFAVVDKHVRRVAGSAQSAMPEP